MEKSKLKFSEHPFGRRRRWRTRLPWFLINLGFAKKGEDCEKVDAEHEWFNIDNKNSGCYFCNVEREGELWKKENAT